MSLASTGPTALPPAAARTAAPRARVQRRELHGVLLLDKPLGLSSNQALQRVKYLLRAQKAGHTGTLDPLATGLLPLCFGAATKFSHAALEADKTYVAALRLGISTEPLRTAQKTILWVIVAVLLLTLVAVVGAAYWLFRRPLALLDMLGDALLRVARGDFHYRIRLERRDELGRLFTAFNLMNGALQTRHHLAERPSPHAAADDATQPTQIITPLAGDEETT